MAVFFHNVGQCLGECWTNSWSIFYLVRDRCFCRIGLIIYLWYNVHFHRSGREDIASACVKTYLQPTAQVNTIGFLLESFSVQPRCRKGALLTFVIYITGETHKIRILCKITLNCMAIWAEHEEKGTSEIKHLIWNRLQHQEHFSVFSYYSKLVWNWLAWQYVQQFEQFIEYEKANNCILYFKYTQIKTNFERNVTFTTHSNSLGFLASSEPNPHILYYKLPLILIIKV